MGSLKSWLQGRNQQNVLNKTTAHMKKVLEVVVEFERGFAFYFEEDNVELAARVFDRVDKLEHEADLLRRDLLLEISKSDLTPQIREYFTHLVRRIDRIANTANGAARRLIGIKEKYVKAMGSDTLEKMLKIVQISVDTTKLLLKLIKGFPGMNFKEVSLLTEKIQMGEHECDKLHSAIYEDLNHKEEEFPFNHFVAIQLSNFIDMLETISDKVEDVADYIELLKTANN